MNKGMVVRSAFSGASQQCFCRRCPAAQIAGCESKEKGWPSTAKAMWATPLPGAPGATNYQQGVQGGPKFATSGAKSNQPNKVKVSS